MRFMHILVASAFVVACGPNDGPEVEDEEVDLERLLEVKAQYEKYADLMELVTETVEAADGSIVPKWANTVFYAYHPETMEGMGVHFIDISYPIDEYSEDRARIVLYDQNDKGEYELAGLEWYFEPLNGVELEETPKVFGVSMDGMMEKHIEGQSDHYDIHGWLWKTSDQNRHGYFSEFNPGMDPPEWFLQSEEFLGASMAMHDPGARAQAGFPDTPGPCIEGAGYPLVNEDLIGVLEPYQADTVLVDGMGYPLGVQWTYPDDGSGPPTHFGQEFHGPDDDGNYYLRVWQGRRTSTKGMFTPTIDTFSCSE